MIKSADAVIVNLTDDISVGGSQEMLIAKYFSKPLVGIAPKGGKFVKDEKIIQGKTYNDYIHPFVEVPCDEVVRDIEGAAGVLKEMFQAQTHVKPLSVINEALAYYEENYLKHDDYVNNL